MVSYTEMQVKKMEEFAEKCKTISSWENLLTQFTSIKERIQALSIAILQSNGRTERERVGNLKLWRIRVWAEINDSDLALHALQLLTDYKQKKLVLKLDYIPNEVWSELQQAYIREPNFPAVHALCLAVREWAKQTLATNKSGSKKKP
jgi:hypothetical protein